MYITRTPFSFENLLMSDAPRYDDGDLKVSQLLCNMIPGPFITLNQFSLYLIPFFFRLPDPEVLPYGELT